MKNKYHQTGIFTFWAIWYYCLCKLALFGPNWTIPKTIVYSIQRGFWGNLLENIFIDVNIFESNTIQIIWILLLRYPNFFCSNFSFDPKICFQNLFFFGANLIMTRKSSLRKQNGWHIEFILFCFILFQNNQEEPLVRRSRWLSPTPTCPTQQAGWVVWCGCSSCGEDHFSNKFGQTFSSSLAFTSHLVQFIGWYDLWYLD